LIIQGPDRLDVFSRQYGWRHPEVWFLPNSAGPTHSPHQPGDNEFRRRFGIEEGTPIALQAGMIGDSTYSLSLARAFAQIGHWALVLHERRERAAGDPYIERLRSLRSPNLHLSLTPVPFDRLAEVYAGATVGLAFYSPGAAGVEGLTISSSGKFALYLCYSKPVLVCGVPALAQIVQDYGCGAAIRDPEDAEEIRAALDRIAASYAEHSKNARVCYEERFNFEKEVRPVIRALQTIAAGGEAHRSDPLSR
jgi:glycosyltransferase involved in cell wall biosynthesis